MQRESGKALVFGIPVQSKWFKIAFAMHRIQFKVLENATKVTELDALRISTWNYWKIWRLWLMAWISIANGTLIHPIDLHNIYYNFGNWMDTFPNVKWLISNENVDKNRKKTCNLHRSEMFKRVFEMVVRRRRAHHWHNLNCYLASEMLLRCTVYTPPDIFFGGC